VLDPAEPGRVRAVVIDAVVVEERSVSAKLRWQAGLAELTGARILAEIGDDRARFADARGLTAYAGSAPVTRASGKASTATS
jgi:transposase